MANGWLGGESAGNGGGDTRETRWLTPRFVVEALGEFDLDPCGAPGHRLARKTYLLEEGHDGLRDPWEGRVWLNPPYGRQQPAWLERLIQHGQGTALIFARTETVSFHEHVWSKASAILFLRGRLNFLDAGGVAAKANAGAPSCLVAYGWRDAALLELCNLPGQFVPLDYVL